MLFQFHLVDLNTMSHDVFCLSDVKTLVHTYVRDTLPQFTRRRENTQQISAPPVLGKRRMISSSGGTFTPLVYNCCYLNPRSCSEVVKVQSIIFSLLRIVGTVLGHSRPCLF
jgi:hypothetical protein